VQLRASVAGRWLGVFRPEVEYTTQPDAPMHTTYKGLDGLARSMESLKEVWESIETEVREFIGSGDVLVACCTFICVGIAASNSQLTRLGCTGCAKEKSGALSSTAASRKPSKPPGWRSSPEHGFGVKRDDLV
jgi:hypothetical protein